MDEKVERVEEPDVAALLKAKARRVTLKALAAAVAVTGLVLALPQ